jgi:hypothetical protein
LKNVLQIYIDSGLHFEIIIPARDDSDLDDDFVSQDNGVVENGNQVDGPRSPPPVDRSKKPKRPTAKPPSITQTDERDSRHPPPRPPLPSLNSQVFLHLLFDH